MRTTGLLALGLLTASLAASADDKTCTTTEADAKAHRDEIVACWDDWKEKGISDDIRGKLQDTLFLEQHWGTRFGTFFAESLKFNADGGVANSTGRIGGPGQALNTPARFDQTEWLYSLKVGWKDKPILKDAYLIWGDRERLDSYRATAKQNDPFRWALLDAVTMNVSYSYGSTLTDPDGDDNFTTKAKGGYEVKAAYTVPLENLFETSIFAAPLRD